MVINGDDFGSSMDYLEYGDDHSDDYLIIDDIIDNGGVGVRNM